MIYMLDTDTCSYIIRQQSQSVLETLQDRANKGHILCMSVFTYQELRFGAERAGSAKYHNRIDKVCERLDYVADWTHSAQRLDIPNMVYILYLVCGLFMNIVELINRSLQPRLKYRNVMRNGRILSGFRVLPD